MGLMLLAAASIYVLPSAVAMLRRHRNVASIMVVNLLLGWTLLGWAVSMAWAVSAAPQVDVRVVRERRRGRHRR
ncbi:MAG: superinfection immunity protein [Planctomycetota bacterium]